MSDCDDCGREDCESAYDECCDQWLCEFCREKHDREAQEPPHDRRD